jgi:hypothetical protein
MQEIVTVIQGDRNIINLNFVLFFQKAWSKAAKIDYTKRGFRSTGRFTLNPSVFLTGVSNLQSQTHILGGNFAFNIGTRQTVNSLRTPMLYLSFHEELASPTQGFGPSKIREEKAAALNLQHALIRYAKSIIKGT